MDTYPISILEFFFFLNNHCNFFSRLPTYRPRPRCIRRGGPEGRRRHASRQRRAGGPRTRSTAPRASGRDCRDSGQPVPSLSLPSPCRPVSECLRLMPRLRHDARFSEPPSCRLLPFLGPRRKTLGPSGHRGSCAVETGGPAEDGSVEGEGKGSGAVEAR